MRAPGDFTNGVTVARKGGEGSLVRSADVEGSDVAVDACGGDHGGTVFVPIVGEGFGGGGRLRGGIGGLRVGGMVQGDREG